MKSGAISSEKIEEFLYAFKRLGNAITPNVCGSSDKTGGHVESLTEAVMGVTSGLCRIADAIDNFSEIIKEKDW